MCIILLMMGQKNSQMTANEQEHLMEADTDGGLQTVVTLKLLLVNIRQMVKHLNTLKIH